MLDCGSLPLAHTRTELFSVQCTSSFTLHSSFHRVSNNSWMWWCRSIIKSLSLHSVLGKDQTWWHKSSVSSLGGTSRWICESKTNLDSQLQDSQNYTGEPCLGKQTNNQTKRIFIIIRYNHLLFIIKSSAKSLNSLGFLDEENDLLRYQNRRMRRKRQMSSCP